MHHATIPYEFTAQPWQYQGKGGWWFVSLPEDISKEIRENLKWQEEGWGRLKAKAQIGQSAWKTAIWFDTQHNTYLLPLKAPIRKKEGIELGGAVHVAIWV